MRRISLNGVWDWHLPHGPRASIRVPSCYRCVGEAIFERSFDLSLADHERAFLCFDGIAYTGRVTLNGRELGAMLPYAGYRFGITDLLRNTGNQLSVSVKDITADYGPTGGWEDYGGISRDVFLDVRDALFVDDLQWLTALRPGSASCALKVWLSGSAPAGQKALVSARISRDGARLWAAEQEAPGDAASFAFELAHPELWSPQSPALYELEVTVSAGGLSDTVRRRVGVRELRVDGERFLLNGEPIFLKGVARHEMWGDQGFTLSDAQIEEDLGLIKRMGANFVRLVHYPHSARTIETADRIGLMVSEEPGLWWSDMGNPAVTDKALEVMRRTILRDRNSPSVVAWLFFNECVLDNARPYLAKGRDLCRSLDPSRLISGANCMDSAVAKAVFDDCGFDFYTQHPYSYEPTALVNAMETLQGKPLVFTEWGGWYIHNNPNLLEWFRRTIVPAARAGGPGRRLAGMCWWQWQDIFQFSRGLPGCEDGLLSDGLVDRNRGVKPMYSVMAELFREIEGPPGTDRRVEHVGARVATDGERRIRGIDLSTLRSRDEQRAACQFALENARRLERTPVREGIRNTGPLLPTDVAAPAGLPITLAPGAPLVLAGKCTSVDIPIGGAVSALHFLGHTTYFDGFPVRGETGITIARYVLFYEKGTPAEVPLRNGIELASASMIARTSRMDPVASAAPRVLVIVIDPDWEVYQVNCFVLRTDRTRKLDRIRFESLSPDFYPLLYGIAVEE